MNPERPPQSTRPPPLLCRWFGHRWEWSLWVVVGTSYLGPRWRRERTCRRCGAAEVQNTISRMGRSMSADQNMTTHWRIRLARRLLRGLPWGVAPMYATDAMVVACLQTSIAVMQRDGVQSVYPDEPGPRPREVARRGFLAMMEAAP